MQHITVLQAEAVDYLRVSAGKTIVDATLGSGGHAREIIQRLQTGTFIGLDIDPQAIADNQALKTNTSVKVTLVNQSFRNIADVLSSLHIETVDGILADLGWRSEQFADSGRGFSFAADEPLLMTLGDPTDYAFTAADIVNEWSAESIANVLYGYAQERYSRRIARALVEQRANEPITTTAELATLVEHAVPAAYRRGKTHPATKTFQALRIAVNDEFAALEEFIPQAFTCLAPGGRLAIISFHSLEDRIVKHTFRSLAHDHAGEIITKKPVVATASETASNPRSRSAKLRVIEKVS